MSQYAPQTQRTVDITQEPSLKRIKVVLEQGDAGSWILPLLPNFLTPSLCACSLIQAMADVSHGGWLQAEPETFWEMLSSRRRTLQKSQGHYQALLQQEGFLVVENEITDASHEGQTQLLESLKEIPQDLLVLGCHQDGAHTPGLRTYNTSSFIIHMATHAPSSVLILKPGLSLQPGARLKVLFATDGSDCSQLATQHFSKVLNTARMDVVLLTVIDPLYMENPVLAPYVNIPAIDSALRQNAELLLTTTQGMLEVEGIHVVKPEVRMGSPAWEILKGIEAEKPDLVVVGSHRPKQDGGWALGSVSHRIVQSSGCSVLVVR